MKQDLSISQLMTTVTQLAKLKKDYLVPTHKLKVSSKGDTTFLDVAGTPYVLQPRAAAQLSSIARIPYSYFSRLQQSYPDLLDMNLNRLLADQDKPRMVRTLGTVARAILSDFDELAKIKSLKDRNEALEKIGTDNFEYTVKSILRKQMIQLYLPEVKAALAALNTQAIKASDTWDGRKYTTQGDYKIENWEEEKALFPKSVDQNLYYVLHEDWGELTLYTKNKRVKPRTRSAEELEREQAIAEKWKYLTEQSGIFYNLRKDYIEKLSVTAKNTPLILYGALIAGTLSAATFNPINRKGFFSVLKMDGVYCGQKTGVQTLELSLRSILLTTPGSSGICSVIPRKTALLLPIRKRKKLPGMSLPPSSLPCTPGSRA